MDRKSFRGQTVEQFFNEMGSSAPAPGGGAAAGMLGAQACALAEMVCQLTVNNKNYAEFHDKAKEFSDVFHMARGIFLDLAEEDADNFMELMKTLREIKTLPMEERKEKQNEAFKKATTAPQQMGETMSSLLPSLTHLLFHGNKNALSDTLIACQCAEACIHSSILNIKINLKYIDDEFFEHDMQDTFRTWEDAISAIDAVLTYQVTL